MSFYQKLADLEKDRKEAALCTITKTSGSTPRGEGSKMIVFPDGSTEGTVGGGELESRVVSAALSSITEGKPATLQYDMNDPSKGDPGVCGGQVEVFVEPILSNRTLLVIGAGHVGKAVMQLGKWLGYYIVASDDRADMCTPEELPDADECIPEVLSRIPDFLKITDRTSIILTTRGVDVDVEGLPSLLDTSAQYIGVIGSKRRWVTAKNQMIESGVPEDALNRVHSPIGLELNAQTPEEIAVSILAEIMMLHNEATGKVMSEDQMP